MRPILTSVVILGDNSLASVNNSGDGQGGNGISGNQSSKVIISKNGRYIAFVSSALDLVGGDTNSERDIFVRDLKDNTTTRISRSSSGVEGNVILMRTGL